MPLDLRAVAADIRGADTDTLLDRATVYRPDLEPAAADLVDGELARRGVTEAEVREHDRRRRADVLFRDDGSARRCSFCDRPAVARRLGRHRLWGRVPVFPRVWNRCEDDSPG